MKKTNQDLFNILEENGLEFYGIQPIERFINGDFTRKKNGNIKYPIEFKGELLKDGVNGLPMTQDDYKFIPYVLFLTRKSEPFDNVEEEK